MSRRWVKGLSLVAIVVLVELVYHLNIFDRTVFPSIFRVFISLIVSLIDGSLLIRVLYTIMMIFLSVILGAFISIILGYFAYFYKKINWVLEVFISILHPLPAIALVPIFLIWFGISTITLMVIVLNAVIWPIIINLQAGFNQIEQSYIDAAKNNGANHLQLFWHILLPLSALDLLSGTKIAWARAFRAMIAAEMLIGAVSKIGGLGWFLSTKRAFMDIEGMFATIVIIVLIGYLMDHFVFLKLEKILSQSSLDI